MNKGKAPGLDGLPPELYLAIWDLIGPLLLDSINFAIDTGCFHRDQNTALISLLLKKGKEPLCCSSYRPISLIGTDVKLYAKVLARRLGPVASFLIAHDQTGFLKERFATDNVRRLLDIIDSPNPVNEQRAILSLDAEKAFDRV
ncbi:hypothetical protein F2P79_025947, partial [Pimephales promelas]